VQDSPHVPSPVHFVDNYYVGIEPTMEMSGSSRQSLWLELSFPAGGRT